MLCLLALFQLIAGPLVLVTVFSFAKVTVREAPSQGVVNAMSAAWRSHEVQTALHVANDDARDTSKSAPTKAAKDKVKLIGISWSGTRVVIDAAATQSVQARVETWTPAWAQAPPGTPPRFG